MPRNGSNIVYAVCGTGEIFRTDDSGRTWRRVHDAEKDMVADCWITLIWGRGGQVISWGLPLILLIRMRWSSPIS